jgi:hypothetical protein
LPREANEEDKVADLLPINPVHDDYEEAFQLMESGQSRKIILDWDA